MTTGAQQNSNRGLYTVGVTGTNGKTSTTRWTAACLARLARPVVQTTTLGSFLDDEPFPASRDFSGFLSAMRAGARAGGRFACVEMTSHALARGFARAWPCRIGIFTNLTRDHLDQHGSAEHYLASKAQLFTALPPGGFAVLNGSDPASELLAEAVPQGVRTVHFGSLSRGIPVKELDLFAAEVLPSWEGTTVVLAQTSRLVEVPCTFRIQAIGEVYAENALAALLAAICAGVPARSAVDALSRAPVPRGRFEVITPHRFSAAHLRAGPRVVVDYAHNPDALARTLGCARRLCKGSLVLVFGAGGDRDHGKRPQMGVVASLADRVVLTSDNPRSEEPAGIASQIREGICQKVEVAVRLDRSVAIRSAVFEANNDDVVLITGKGHECHQSIRGQTVPFDDGAEARSALTVRWECGPATE